MEETSTIIRLSAAAAYGICSILIVFVNKILLTNLRFPSFLCAGIGQMLATVSILFVASSFRIVSVPSFDRSIPRKFIYLTYRFPSFLCAGIGQMLATVSILFVASSFRIVSVPSFDRSIPRKIFPLPLIYVLNLVSGLGGTQKINLPMFTVLRRFSIVMTMILEYIILGFVLFIY
uniref:WAT1-related protein n=1 Tax=Ascaris lumbricoides TaxID=6252 RepID=A0A0M3ISJ8_ASCLU